MRTASAEFTVDHAVATAAAPRADRVRLLAAIALAIALAGAVLRVVLAASEHVPGGAGGLTGALALGAVNDLLTAAIALAPLGAFLALSGGGSLRRRWVRLPVLAALGAALVFGAAVEYYFFAEFTARFNHIAVDYLLFPGEVATNVWESYDVPLWLAISLAAGTGFACLTSAWLNAPAFAPLPWRRRLAGAGAAVLAGGVAYGALVVLPARPTGDRVLDEIAANGLVQLARAFATAHLPYDVYYRTLPRDEAAKRTAAEIGWKSPADPHRAFPAAVAREKPLDVLVVLEESLGSEFVARLGGKDDAPHLERWADQGLLLTNLVATGNRTVRGLEGVLCSFPPLPGDSVWKRDKSENVATVARVLRDRGYDTTFVYGGAGAFDGMKPFALANGWNEFIEDGVVSSDYPKDAFRTAWGAADEYVFARLLERQRQAQRDGKPLFATMLSTSNHKPFLTPDSKGVKTSSAKVQKWGLRGGVILALCVAGWFLLAPRVGRVRISVVVAVILAGYGVWFWVKVQPKDSRDNAVRYSDRALGDYLDRAKAAGVLDHTVVLVVGDHGARVYGAEEIPAESYRIPALFVAPDAAFKGKTIDRLCSQVDLAPTLLSLAGVSYEAPFFGDDLLRAPGPDGGRAWLIHNRDIGLLTDRDLVVLGLQKSVTAYSRAGKDSDTFAPAGTIAPGSPTAELADRAAAVYQTAADLYENRAYVVPPAAPR